MFALFFVFGLCFTLENTELKKYEMIKKKLNKKKANNENAPGFTFVTDGLISIGLDKYIDTFKENECQS